MPSASRSSWLAQLRRRETQLAAAQLRALAAVKGCDLALRLHPTAFLSARARFDLPHGGSIRLSVGDGCVIERDVVFRLGDGADIVLGPRVRFRSRCVLNVTGHLAFEADNLLSWNSVVHCARQVTFARMSGTGEGVTVVDGAHFRRSATDHWYANNRTAPVVIGPNAWLASHCTVTAGVTVGEAATVSANSLVRHHVPPATLVCGVPAVVVRHRINDAPRPDPAQPGPLDASPPGTRG